MITRHPRPGYKDYYDLKITDKNGKEFIMTVGGNLDLYWLPKNHKQDRVFQIDKQDELTFSVFDQLFSAVKKKDNIYNPVLKGDTITFVSEDRPEEEANILNIIKTKNEFTIKFIENENRELWTNPHRGCSVCFCNSGSRVPEVENLFMRMFNYLAYHSDLIPFDHRTID